MAPCVRACLAYVLAVTLLPGAMRTSTHAQALQPRLVELDDLYRVRAVGDPQVSPDGEWVAYTVSIADSANDRNDSDVWMTSWDGARSIRLTTSEESEWLPKWSPDGRYLAFLSSRDDTNEVDQVWLLNRLGGEAVRITDLPGGVSAYVWSPDGSKLALIASDPDPDDGPDGEDRTPKPIVIDRLQFKEDETGYLGKQRDHLYLFDLDAQRAVLLTPGDYYETLPSFSPDGRSIAFVSKRRPEFDRNNNWDIYVVAADSGATPRAVTTFEGADGDPDYASAPAWSPDGRYLAYLQGGELGEIYYGLQQLAVVPAAGGTARVLTAELDRNVWTPSWSPDGRSILFLLEDDRSTYLASVAAGGGDVRRLVSGKLFLGAFSVGPDGRIAVLSSTPQRPFEVYSAEEGGLRGLSRQNDAWLAQVRLAPAEEIEFTSADGTAVHGFLMRPPDAQPNVRHPTVLRVHGGPVYQFSNEFDLSWQLLAAEGFAVIAANPRGSSGRGAAFQRAIYADWGNKDAQDVLAAVDHVVAMGVADSARLGIGGWSYGGMLTNYVIAQDTRFKAAVSGSSISNILGGYGTDQYVREYEAELGRPWENLDTWLRVSFPFLHADRIVTPTLFMCGSLDFNVPLLGSEQMYQALRSLGRETQLVIYPGEYHSISAPSNQRDRLARYLAWYGKLLGADGKR